MGLKNNLFLITILIFSSLISGCGGGGGSAIITNPISIPDTKSDGISNFPLKILFIDSTNFINASPSREISTNYLTINGKKISPNSEGYIDGITINKGESIDINGEINFIPNFNSNEGLFIKVMSENDKKYFLRVYWNVATDNGINLRSSLIYKNGTEENVLNGNNEKVSGENFSSLIGRYISKTELLLSPEVEDMTLLNNEKIINKYNINPFVGVGFSGEVKLVIEPSILSLEFNGSGQFTSKIMDETGTNVIIQAHWEANPPGLVDLDNTGLIKTREVPGVILITAEYTNLFASATLEVKMPAGGNAISGIIDKDLTLKSDVVNIISGDLIINEGVTLTVEGGAQVHFLPKIDSAGDGENVIRTELIVHGTLITKGFKTRHTQFISDSTRPGNTDYYGIMVTKTGVVNLENCNIRDAVYGVKCDGGEVTIIHSIIENCQTGISASNLAKLHVEGTEIVKGNSGIECNVSGNVEIFRNYIADNSFYGITIYTSNPIIYGNIILRSANVGISINTSSYPVIENNIIASSGIYGINVENGTVPEIKNNIINHSDNAGIMLKNGSRPSIINNIIYSNHAGMKFRNESGMIFQYNNSSSNKIASYFNIDTENDSVFINGEWTKVHLLPNNYGENPDFNNPDYINPNIGDFSLQKDEFLLTAGKNTSAIGLMKPFDIGTSSVNFGEEVTQN